MRSLLLLKKQKLFLASVLFSCSFSPVFAQEKDVTFTSSDKKLEVAFEWAKDMALHYKGKPGDPVGSWYESALPPRSAFCMRDVSHQCIGGEILGLSHENGNMINLFVSNISASKNWCTYWEMNKWAKPAPEDYRSDKEFWYNLPANFDVLSASWRLYLWTGDRHYIDDPAFTQFQERSVADYIASWVLYPDSLLTRPAHPNAPIPYNESDSFDRCRGLPSYSEGVPNLKMGADLVAALYRGLTTYGLICKEKGDSKKAALYFHRAKRYQKLLDSIWWDKTDQRYYTYYSNDNKFGKQEGETFLLWFDALKDTSRTNRTLAHLASRDWNVENTSYLPLIFYQNGRWDQARNYILYLADPSTSRREYPEVSFGIIEAFVQGLMGISPDARTGIISTIYKTNGTNKAAINDLPVLHTTVTVAHIDHRQSVITNTGKNVFKWKAMFYGVYKKACVNNELTPVKRETDRQGREISFVVTQVPPGRKVNIRVEN